MKIDAVTKRWIRNASDERAASNGCRFDEVRGQHVIDFCERYLRLYEGEHAGQPLVPRDWQREVLMRLFGWVKPSEFWGREIRRFRKASIWVPKKNKKSPTAAAVGLYLLCADGEQGQKVFSAAKDGKQAAIVHTHAQQMVLRSPELSAVCTINKSTGRITHVPSASFYSILSGDNIEGQEGLNGSVIVDETHVVDRRLASVLEYMGASRSEPLQFEVSTAGKNPDSYGRRQYLYGKDVESGKTFDEGFFFAAWEAPQDASDDALQSDPKLWKAANPAWGHTINEDEFRDSLNRAKRSLSDWVDFKTYRLNVWSNSASPWLRKEDWDACGRSYSADDLAGQACWLGLDLSKTCDMTAAVLVFPDGEDGYRQLPFFWMPEEEAKRKDHLASFLAWSKAGRLTLTPGNVVDYRTVRADLAELANRFDIRAILFDRTYAEELTQTLADDCGIAREAFPQTIMTFAGPTAAYERLILAGKLHHNRHPILSWQAGHVQVKTDLNGNKRPVKPDAADHRKIDGIVAAIMALSGALSAKEQTSVYETRGVLAFNS